MKRFSEDAIRFICRAKENRKYEELESLLTSELGWDLGDSMLMKGAKVRLYTGTPIKNKRFVWLL